MVQPVTTTWRSGVPRTVALLLFTALFSVAANGQEEVCPEGNGEACCNLDWAGQGATIVQFGGDVLVSQIPYVDATLGMRVNNGGRVMTLNNGFAVVAFDDSCRHEMDSNELLIIEDVSPCCAAALSPPSSPPVTAPANQAWIPPAAAVVLTGICAAACDTDEGRTPEPISR
jgi:hypothetical protein